MFGNSNCKSPHLSIKDVNTHNKLYTHTHHTHNLTVGEEDVGCLVGKGTIFEVINESLN